MKKSRNFAEETIQQLNECYMWIDEIVGPQDGDSEHIKNMLQGLEDAIELLRTHCNED